MNTAKRQEVENKLENVKVTLCRFNEQLRFNEELDFNLTDLTDKEISNLYSNFNWGMKKGIITTNDRVEGTSLKWEA
jgi:hypothetical protein